MGDGIVKENIEYIKHLESQGKKEIILSKFNYGDIFYWQNHTVTDWLLY